jgi:3-hydroxyacyl-[acyl-carrier-protein] dehydratase
MLRNDFYTILSKKKSSENSFSATIVINENHAVFDGHFPQNPVVPGVCMLQMVKDLMEDELHKSIQLQSIGNVKFTAVVNPAQNPELDIKISYELSDGKSYKINSIISSKEVVFLKIVNAVYLG